jgi:hypothetical protein
MNWIIIWFIVYLIELGILSYVAYLHFEQKIIAIKPKRIKFTITRTITEVPQEKTKREIMEG